MSIASTYAAALAAAEGDVAAVEATSPTPFVGPSGGRLEVTTSGDLRVVPANGIGGVEIPAAGVPSVITWLTTNFI